MNDIELEKRVLSGGFINAERLETLLESSDKIFYFEPHKIIYNAYQYLYDLNEKFDSIILLDHLKELYDEKAFKQIEKYVTDIVITPFSVNLKYDIKQLHKLYRRRETKKFILKFQDDNDIEKLIDNLESVGVEESDEMDYSEFINQDLDTIFSSGNYIPGSLSELNRKIIGYFDGQLIVIAARPGVGKSTFAWQEAQHVNDGAIFFSLEMKKRELYAKSLSRLTGIPTSKIEKNKSSEMLDCELGDILKAHLKLQKQTKLKVFDTDNSIVKIKNTIKKHNKSGWLRLVIIDYLQIIKSSEMEERIRFSNITRDLKLLAMEISIPIILLSQLTRDSENRMPTLRDLSGSGAIENNSDVVIFLHEIEDDQGDEETIFIVAKNRKGKRGRLVNMSDKSLINFNKPASRFEVISFDQGNNSYNQGMMYIHN